MKIKRFVSAGLLSALAMIAVNGNAAPVDANAARQAASEFVKHNAATQGTLRTAAMADLKLSHAEASSVEGNAYYVFNIKGGGWVIIAGDDRANQVLAYSDRGSLDMNQLPENTKGYLDRYKAQIEFMQNYKGEVKPLNLPKRTTAIEPLLPSVNWAQQSPFNYQCVFNGTSCSVGCAGLAMAQILNYWQYPKQVDGLAGYSPSWQLSVPSLPATTFDYSLIRDQYTTWTEDGKLAWVDGVTEEEKQEVAKLCRYASQSCLMNFSPDGSGSNVTKQKNGFITMGYSTDAKLVGIEAWPTRETWNTTDYTDEEWVALINAQLEARRPIPYSSEGFTDGHAFVIDGVDIDGLYHVSWGWYGRGDGWFQFGAFNVTVQGQSMAFNESLFMVIDLYPYVGYEPPVDQVLGDINGDGIAGIADVTDLIDALLAGTAGSLDLSVADCDHTGEVSISDATALIDYLLSGTW
jgi:hypothetical protein